MHYPGERLDTHVYIDGFNLYYGLLRETPFRWLDLERFCDVLLPKNRMVETGATDPRQHVEVHGHLVMARNLNRKGGGVSNDD